MNLSIAHKGIARKIISNAVIISPDSGESLKISALWDTGATNTMISNDVAKKLDLKEADIVQVTHVAGKETLSVYLAAIEIQGGLKIIEHKLIAMPSIHAFDMLIGMDIISNGDFRIKNENGKSVFTFSC